MSCRLLTQVRMDRGLSRGELAKQISKTEGFLAEIERGRVALPARVAIQLGRILEIDPVDLLADAKDLPIEVAVEVAEVEIARELAATHTIERVAAMSYRAIEKRAEDDAMQLFASEVRGGFGIPILEPLMLGDVKDIRLEVLNDCDEEAAAYVDGSDQGVLRLRADVRTRALRGDGRARFTVAHELGHLRLHRAELLQQPGVRMFRDSACSPSRALKPGMAIYESPEWAANSYASAFLAPVAALRAYLGSRGLERESPSSRDIAHHFGLSVQAAQIRVEKALPRLMTPPS